jgi:hypothetical protein
MIAFLDGGWWLVVSAVVAGAALWAWERRTIVRGGFGRTGDNLRGGGGG